MAETSGNIRRSARFFGLRSGPLSRRADRIQAFARLLLVAAVLGSIPIAIILSVATYGRFHLQETVAARGSYSTTATLVVDAVPPTGPSTPDKGAAQSVVTWTTSAGARGRAVVAVAPGAAAGSTVRIWIDGQGAVTTRTPPTSDAAGLALGVGLLTVVGSATVAALLYLLVRTVLDRRRFRGWEGGWAAVEPVWSGKVR